MSPYIPFRLQQQKERSLFGKSFVLWTYKYEWPIVDNESCNRTCSQIKYFRNENEIPLLREFPFSGTTNKPFSQYLSGIHLLLSSTIWQEALIARYFGIMNWNLLEVSSQFEYSLRRRVDARKVSFFTISWLFEIWPWSARLMPNFGVSLSHQRYTAVSFETNNNNKSNNNSNCLFTYPQESEKEIKEVIPN